MLYESTRQPQDALACYNNAKGANSPHLHQRIKYLKAQLSNLPPAPPPPMQTGPGMKPKQLPSVEEAWNVPISNEMTSRHPAPSTTAGGAAGMFFNLFSILGLFFRLRAAVSSFIFNYVIVIVSLTKTSGRL